MLVEHGSTCVMVDCGFSTRQAERRLANLGKSASELSAILVTHEHSDHVCGVASLARKYAVPVWMTPGTERGSRLPQDIIINSILTPGNFQIGDLSIESYAMPHDANEPCQFVFDDGAKKIGLLTDIGTESQTVINALYDCDALLMECNHDDDMLFNSHYPDFLKARISGNLGHFSNQQTAALLSKLDTSKLQHFVALHLSEKNNHEELVKQTVSRALGCEENWVAVAKQGTEFQWRELV